MNLFQPVCLGAAPTDEVEVFATDITCAALAAQVQQRLQQQVAGLRISFDLEDCDHILRVQAAHGSVALWQQILLTVRELGIGITMLPD